MAESKQPKPVFDRDWAEIIVHNETFKWNEPGDTLVGTYMGMVEGSLGGELVRVDTDDGIHAASAPVRLATALQSVTPGQVIKIVYQGEVKAGQFGRVKDFKLFVER